MGNLTLKKSKMSKINQDQLKKSIDWIRENRKQRNYVETVDLQIMLRDYNPDKEKRFNSAVALPNKCRAKQNICVIGNVTHVDQCKKLGVPFIDLDGIKKFNKVAKVVKKWARKFDSLLVSESLNKQTIVQVGKILSSIHRLPVIIPDAEKVGDKLVELQQSVRWRIKKVPWLAQGCGVDTLSNEEIRQNLNKAINFLISLLPKGWLNLKTVHIKFTMGKGQRIF